MEKTAKEKEKFVNKPYNFMLFVVMAEGIAVLNHTGWVIRHAPLSLLILVCNVIILSVFRMIGKKKKEEEEEDNIKESIQRWVAWIGGSIIALLMLVVGSFILAHFFGSDDQIRSDEPIMQEQRMEFYMKKTEKGS